MPNDHEPITNELTLASLYLHIPFCEHKCIYCDFYSIESLDSMERFLAALKQEILMYTEVGEREKFETIFFGGGTPSLLEPPVLESILSLLRRTFNVHSDAEVTLEANPGTVEMQKLGRYREIGINRLSFGVQSFFDDDLRFLTRIHSSQEAKKAVRLAREAGFDNINIDLIFALPNQSMLRWEQNLHQAVELETQHISAYSLIVEKNTPLYRMVAANQVTPLPIHQEAELYQYTMEFLQEAGYVHYEVSNYAKPGFQSRHNSSYWNHSNYLSFGPSAHSFWSNKRWWNIANLSTYCEKIFSGELPINGKEELTREQLFDEAVMLGLRYQGIDIDLLKVSYGVDLAASHKSIIDALLQENLAMLDDGKLRLTNQGFLLCDEITRRLLSNVILS